MFSVWNSVSPPSPRFADLRKSTIVPLCLKAEKPDCLPSNWQIFLLSIVIMLFNWQDSYNNFFIVVSVIEIHELLPEPFLEAARVFTDFWWKPCSSHILYFVTRCSSAWSHSSLCSTTTVLILRWTSFCYIVIL